jgi:subtilisin family serine protease
MATRKRATGDRSLHVVYIHGIGNKVPPRVLKEQWDRALFGAPAEERTRMAYWADLFHPEPLRAGQTGARTAAVAAASGPEDQVAEYGPAAKAFARRLEARLRATAPRGKSAKVLPPFLRRTLTKWITREFVRDVAAYFYDAGMKQAMQARLRELLIPERAPYVVIAHSMGTVISYDVLHDVAKDGLIRDYITIGSPLGIQEVQDHIRHPLAVPKGLRSWWNFADASDPIALDRKIGNDYAPKGAIEDVEVDNPHQKLLQFWSAHSIDGYLQTTPVRERVEAILGPSARVTAARGIVARNVADETFDPEQRVEILIELDDKIAGADLEKKRSGIVSEIRKIAKGHVGEAQIDPLRHFVAASLTASEIDKLAVAHGHLGVFRIWKNEQKRTLMESVARTLQVNTARAGYRADGRGIAWAVLDTGVRPGHPHFAKHKNVVAHYDCTQPGEPPLSGKGIDRDGHGTHVCGILAGEGTGRYDGLAGMAPRTELHVYKVLADDGLGNDSWIIKALDHIAAQNEASASLRIHGVNLSLGGPFDATVYGCGFTPVCKELRRLWRQGVVVCLAAGNEGRVTVETADGQQDLNFDLSIGDPANLEEAISVGSVHKDQPHRYGVSYFSSRGPTADGRAKPDIVAPGERVISADAGFRKDDPKTWYVEMSGTSMACPAVSGMIAAFLSVRREFIGAPDEVKRFITKHATDLGRDHYHQGAGLANLVRMLMET